MTSLWVMAGKVVTPWGSDENRDVMGWDGGESGDVTVLHGVNGLCFQESNYVIGW